MPILKPKAIVRPKKNPDPGVRKPGKKGTGGAHADFSFVLSGDAKYWPGRSKNKPLF